MKNFLKRNKSSSTDCDLFVRRLNAPYTWPSPPAFPGTKSETQMARELEWDSDRVRRTARRLLRRGLIGIWFGRGRFPQEWYGTNQPKINRKSS